VAGTMRVMWLSRSEVVGGDGDLMRVEGSREVGGAEKRKKEGGKWEVGGRGGFGGAWGGVGEGYCVGMLVISRRCGINVGRGGGGVGSGGG